MANVNDIELSEDELNALIGELDATGEEIAKSMPEPTTKAPVEVDGIVVLENEIEEIAEAAAPAPTPAETPAANVIDELEELESDLAELEAPAAVAPVAKPEPKTVAPVEAVKPVKLVEPIESTPTQPAESTVKPVEAMDAPLKPKPTKLQHYVDPHKFQAETAINDANLDNCMMEQSSLRAYYGAQAAHAEAQHSRMKARFDVLEAKLFDTHRKLLAASGEKVTEKMVENAVKLDPRWLSLKNDVIEAETIASVNKNLVFSLADRRDMLIQLGSDRRAESQGQMRILAAQEGASSLTAKAVNAARTALGDR